MSVASVLASVPGAIRPPPAAVAAATRAARPAALPAQRRQQRLIIRAAAASNSSGSATATPASVAADLDVLREACRTKKVAPDDVLAAMQRVEAAHKQQSLVQGFPAKLTGTWRLVFSTPSPIKAWQYIPVLEDAVIDVDAGTIDLVSVVGPLDNAFKGTCSFDSDPATGKHAMNFAFSASEATWFGRWKTRSDFESARKALAPVFPEFAPKAKTYTYFLLTDDVAAANSSGGPKTLMYRVT